MKVWSSYSTDTIRAHAVVGDEEGFGTYATIARLAPGMTRERAGTELDTCCSSGSSPRRRPPAIGSTRARSRSPRTSRGVPRVCVAWIAAAIVISILCAVNFATMSLARGMRRRGEIAVRAALGATPRRVVALLASEGALIALAGGLLSVVFAYGLIGSSHVWLGEAMPVAPTVGWRMIAFGVLATTIVGARCALAPAIDLSKPICVRSSPATPAR